MIAALAHRARRIGSDETGSTILEFALVAPILAFAVAGLADIGSATHARLSLDARVTAMTQYAMLQAAPADQVAANALAARLAGLLSGDAAQTAQITVNNAARATWTGEAVEASVLPGEPAACYCPTIEGARLNWGSVAACETPCADGGVAGRFLHVSASARHLTIFPGYPFLDGQAVSTQSVLRLP